MAMDDDAKNRSDALRQALVTTVSSAAWERPRSRRKVVAAAIGAFALAGALTGGALASAALTSVDPSAPYTWVAAAAHASNEGRLIGTPVIAAGTDETTLHLGKAPKGVTTVFLSYTCPGGSLSVKVGGTTVDTHCKETTVKNPTTAEVKAATDRGIDIRVASPGSKPYVIWASWAKPVALQSAQQKLELIDGVVTRDEYLAAFNRMVGCMTAGGYAFDVPPQSTTLLNYVTDENNDGYFMAVCYPREFMGVDSAWQIENELSACLTSHAIVPQASVKEMTVQLSSAGVDLRSCP